MEHAICSVWDKFTMLKFVSTVTTEQSLHFAPNSVPQLSVNIWTKRHFHALFVYHEVEQQKTRVTLTV